LNEEFTSIDKTLLSVPLSDLDDIFVLAGRLRIDTEEYESFFSRASSVKFIRETCREDIDLVRQNLESLIFNSVQVDSKRVGRIYGFDLHKNQMLIDLYTTYESHLSIRNEEASSFWLKLVWFGFLLTLFFFAIGEVKGVFTASLVLMASLIVFAYKKRKS